MLTAVAITWQQEGSESSASRVPRNVVTRDQGFHLELVVRKKLPRRVY